MNNFPFNSNIPASTNSPSSDQPLMLQNNVSTAAILGTDHVSFGIDWGGSHKQTTFTSNNVPTVPTTFPVLFTNTQDGAGNILPGGIPELFIYSGDSTQSNTQYVVLSSGSIVTFAGIIIKWGSFIPGASPFPITFVPAFPNACFSVTVTPSASSSTATASVGTVTASGFQIYTNRLNALHYYIAIGN